MVRRKRICQSCQRRFTTLEKIEQLSIRVVKRDQTREPLDREKIRRGIERACSKRPISSPRIERIVQAVENDIYSSCDTEVTTSQIGDFVMQHLAPEDEVAYIRFSSVYRDFDDAQDFVQAISKMMGLKSDSANKPLDDPQT